MRFDRADEGHEHFGIFPYRQKLLHDCGDLGLGNINVAALVPRGLDQKFIA